MVELVTQIDGKSPAHTSTNPLVMHLRLRNIDIIKEILMAHAPFHLQITVQTGESRPAVDSDAYSRHRARIGGVEQTATGQFRVRTAVLLGLNARRNIDDIEPNMGVR